MIVIHGDAQQTADLQDILSRRPVVIRLDDGSRG